MGRGLEQQAAATLAPRAPASTADPGAEKISEFFAAAGITPDQWRERCDAIRNSPATFTASYFETPDGLTVPGIVYRTDYRGQEEYGIHELREAFCGPRERDFTMRPSATDNVRVIRDRDRTCLVLVTNPHEFEFHFEEDLAADRSDLRKRSDTTRKLGIGRHDTVKELRERARSLGVSPLPRTRTELKDAIAAKLETSGQAEDLWAASFRSGDVLVLEASGSGPTAKILEHLAQAAEAGRLTFGNASGPYHRGTFFLDAGHETQATIDERERIWDWHDARISELGDLPDRLKNEDRLHLYFLGNPREGTWNDEQGETRYWLNATYRVNGQQWYPMSGWWTLDQLRQLAENPAFAYEDNQQQLQELEADRQRILAQRQVDVKFEPDRVPPGPGQARRYRFSVKDADTGEYLIDQPSADRDLIKVAADDLDAAIEVAQARTEQRRAEANARLAAREAQAASS